MLRVVDFKRVILIVVLLGIIVSKYLIFVFFSYFLMLYLFLMVFLLIDCCNECNLFMILVINYGDEKLVVRIIFIMFLIVSLIDKVSKFIFFN